VNMDEVRAYIGAIEEITRRIQGCENTQKEEKEAWTKITRCAIKDGLEMYIEHMKMEPNKYTEWTDSVTEANTREAAEKVEREMKGATTIITVGLMRNGQAKVTVTKGEAKDGAHITAQRRDLAKAMAMAAYVTVLDYTYMTDGECNICPFRRACNYHMLVEFLRTIFREYLKDGERTAWMLTAAITAAALAEIDMKAKLTR